MPIVQPIHPEWDASKSSPTSFLHSYAPIVNARYPLHDTYPVKLFSGPQAPRVCSLCAPSVDFPTTFRSVSHAIPAALGNRRYFSNEECDRCNKSFGAQDEELAKCFAAQRLLNGVRGRDGYVSIKPDEKEQSRVGATGRNQLGVWRTEGDEAVLFKIHEGNRGTLAFGLPSYRPMRALQSLLRSCWLLMTPASRVKYPYLRTWILTSIPTPSKFLRYTISQAAFAHVELTLWEASKEEQSAALVLQFTFCDTVLCWTLPDESGRQVPSLLPPFEIGAQPPGVSLSTIESPEAFLFDIRANWEFTYDSKRSMSPDEAHKAPEPSTPTPPPPEGPVWLCLEREDSPPQLLASILLLQHQDATLWRFRIRGGGFAGTMDVEVNVKTNDSRIHFKFLPHLTSAADALATLEWLANFEDGADVIVRSQQAKGALFRGHLHASLSVGRARQCLGALSKVNLAFGTDLRCPQSDETFDWEGVIELSQIVGGSSIKRGPTTITAKTEDSVPIRRALSEAPLGTDFLVVHEDVRATIAGIAFPLGQRSTTVIAAQLHPNASGDGDTIVIKCEGLVERYANWTREDLKEPTPSG